MKVLKSAAPVATKNLAYRLTLNISAPAVKDSTADSSEHHGDDGVERNAAKIALDRCMEALSIYSNYVLYSYKEASCSLRLARMIDELGSLAMVSIFERHTKVCMHTYLNRLSFIDVSISTSTCDILIFPFLLAYITSLRLLCIFLHPIITSFYFDFSWNLIIFFALHHSSSSSLSHCTYGMYSLDVYIRAPCSISTRTHTCTAC